MRQKGDGNSGDFARKKELQVLLDLLAAGQSVALIAPRRFGKSSLIKQALRQIKGANRINVFIDLLSSSTTELLSTALIRETLKNFNLHKEFMAARTGVTSFYTNKDLHQLAAAFPFIARLDDETLTEEELLSECFHFPEALSSSQNRPLICAFDGFGTGLISATGGQLLPLITSKIEPHNSTTYLLSGRNESAFRPLKDFQIIHLGYQEKQQSMDSLKNSFNSLKIKIPHKLTTEIVTFTKGHPYYTQLAFQQTLLIHSLEGSTPNLKELRNHMLAAESSYMEKVWEDLSGNKEHREVLLALTEGSKNIYRRLKAKKINVARAQKDLEGMGYLIKRKSGGYKIADPLFKYWLRKSS